MEEESYKLVIKAAQKIRDSKVGMLIINPAPLKDIKSTNWGKRLADKVVNITDCKYIEISPTIHFVTPFKQEFYIKEQQLENFYNAFNDTKMSLR